MELELSGITGIVGMIHVARSLIKSSLHHLGVRQAGEKKWGEVLSWISGKCALPKVRI